MQPTIKRNKRLLSFADGQTQPDVVVFLSRDHFQALVECFEIGFEGKPDDYPYGIPAGELQDAFNRFREEEAEG